VLAGLRGLSLVDVTCSGAQAQLVTVCSVKSDADVEARFTALPDALRQVVAGARARSPAVRVVCFTYFTVLPEQGTVSVSR
jgi:hypothetical protein